MQPAPPAPEPQPLRFLSLEELHEQAPPEPPWIWEDYLARGTITLIAGKPKVGKSSLVFGLVRAILSNEPTFLGRNITSTGIVYVSEEGKGTLKGKLPMHGDMTIMSREEAWPPPKWAELVQAAVLEAERTGAGLIVIDTLRKWARFAQELEKDASAMQAVVSALDLAVARGLAVVLVHHQRKAEGENGDAVSGTNALPGAVDVVLEVERTETGGNQRVLLAESRWNSPAALLFEKHRDDEDYDLVSVGESKAEVAGDALRQQLYEHIAAAAQPLIVLVILLLLGGGYGYGHRGPRY
jgi:archaellum biogenesis ATPase FlaH